MDINNELCKWVFNEKQIIQYLNHQLSTIKQSKKKKRYTAMRAILTPDDLKKGDLAEPNWYQVVIDSYEEKEANGDKSTNCIFHFKIEAKGDGTPTPFKGVSPQALFNEKAMGFGKKLWQTLEFPFDAEKGYDLSTDLFKQSVGSRLKIYIARGMSNKNNPFNEVKDYAKI